MGVAAAELLVAAAPAVVGDRNIEGVPWPPRLPWRRRIRLVNCGTLAEVGVMRRELFPVLLVDCRLRSPSPRSSGLGGLGKSASAASPRKRCGVCDSCGVR